MKYLLDTCVISDFYEGEKKTIKKIKSKTPNKIFISVITVAEVHYGISKIAGTKKGEKISEHSEKLFGLIKVIPLSYEVAKVAGSIRSTLEKKGGIIGAHDILIAATAKVHNLVMVTSNTREFSQVEDLKLEDWREVK